MIIRRGCYNKFHRCPGWSGGGPKYPKFNKVVCPGKSNGWIYERKLWKWRVFRCPECQTVILPYVTRYFDPFWLAYEVKYKVKYDWCYNRADKR